MMEQLTQRIKEQADSIQTEEATKHALVMPFLNAMDYDVFDPHEVVPEYTADFFMKNNEKVDYAIMRDGKPAIVIECKQIQDDLTEYRRYPDRRAGHLKHHEGRSWTCPTKVDNRHLGRRLLGDEPEAYQCQHHYCHKTHQGESKGPRRNLMAEEDSKNSDPDAWNQHQDSQHCRNYG